MVPLSEQTRLRTFDSEVANGATRGGQIRFKMYGRTTMRGRGIGVLLAGVAMVAESTLVTLPAGALSINGYYANNFSDSGASVSQATCELKTNTTCTLRDAITFANQDGSLDFDTIFLSPKAGTYVLDGPNHPLVVTSNSYLSIDGSGPATSIIDGGNTSQVFSLSAGALSISGVTITRGYTTQKGGAIFNSKALTLSNVNVTGNSALLEGGAIFSSGTLSIEGGGLSNNSSINGCGGAVASSGTLTVTRASFVSNESECGGAIQQDPGGPIMVESSLIKSNYVRDYGDGGGFLLNGTATLTNDTIVNNTTTEYGGGLSAVNNANVSLTQSTIANNNAFFGGGGVYLSSTNGHLNLVGNILNGNTQYMGQPSQCLAYYGTFTSTYNVVGSNVDLGCHFVGSGDQNGKSAGLGALAVHGGPTPTEAIPTSSPAFQSVPIGACLPTDARGVARTQTGPHGYCDAGAYEVAAATGPVSCTTISGTAPNAVTLSGCTPKSTTSKSASISSNLIGNAAGAITWHPSSKTSYVVGGWTAKGQGVCAAKYTEEDFSGAVMSGSSTYTHFFDRASIRLCLAANNTVKIAPGSKVAL